MGTRHDPKRHPVFIKFLHGYPQVIRFPLPALQLDLLFCKMSHISHRTHSLLIIRNKCLQHIIEFPRTFQRFRFQPEHLYILRPFHIIFNLKNLIKNLIRKRFRRADFTHSIQQFVFRFLQAFSPPPCQRNIHRGIPGYIQACILQWSALAKLPQNAAMQNPVQPHTTTSNISSRQHRPLP